MTARQVHRVGTIVLSVVMLAVGVALIVETIAGEAGALSGRTVLGVCFLAAGAGRLYVESRRGRGT